MMKNNKALERIERVKANNFKREYEQLFKNGKISRQEYELALGKYREMIKSLQPTLDEDVRVEAEEYANFFSKVFRDNEIQEALKSINKIPKILQSNEYASPRKQHLAIEKELKTIKQALQSEVKEVGKDTNVEEVEEALNNFIEDRKLHISTFSNEDQKHLLKLCKIDEKTIRNYINQLNTPTKSAKTLEELGYELVEDKHITWQLNDGGHKTTLKFLLHCGMFPQVRINTQEDYTDDGIIETTLHQDVIKAISKQLKEIENE